MLKISSSPSASEIMSKIRALQCMQAREIMRPYIRMAQGFATQGILDILGTDEAGYTLSEEAAARKRRRMIRRGFSPREGKTWPQPLIFSGKMYESVAAFVTPSGGVYARFLTRGAGGRFQSYKLEGGDEGELYDPSSAGGKEILYMAHWALQTGFIERGLEKAKPNIEFALMRGYSEVLNYIEANSA